MIERFSEYGYVGVFCALLASGLGFPIPEELPVLTAGVLVGHGDTPKRAESDDPNVPGPVLPLDPNRLKWYVMIPVCIVGVVIGDGFLYAIGRVWGRRLLKHPWVQRKLVPPDKRERIEKNFHDRGIMILLTARLTPGIRTPIFLMAGVLRVPLARFVLADALYAIPGVGILFALSYWLTDRVMDVYHSVERYKLPITLMVLSAVSGVVLWKIFTSWKVTTGSPEEVPALVKPVEKVAEAVEHAVEAAIEKTIVAVTTRSHSDARPAGPPDPPPPPPPPPANP
jgi:membrane protein DedA with SNARE-associated domain